MAQILTPRPQPNKVQITRAVYDAMEKQHPIEHATWIKWVKEGWAEILETN